MTNCVTYNSTIENWILLHLDGWVIEDENSSSSDDDDSVNPFMTTSEANEKANKVITSSTCQLFYESTLNDAYMHTNRLNIDDLTTVESNVFIQAVCKWTASNLWNKYNIRVNNEDMEDVNVSSYGGLLYKSALKTLNQFINQRVKSMSSITDDDDSDETIWIV